MSDIGKVTPLVIDEIPTDPANETDPTIKPKMVTRPSIPIVWASELNLCEQPPKRNWLLTDVRTGAGMLLAGKPFILAASGGTGKGYFEIHIAVAIALGIPAFDILQPSGQGYVALVVGEDDTEECRNRLWRVCNALHLDRDQRHEVERRLLVIPMAGMKTALVAMRDGSPMPTELCRDLTTALCEQAANRSIEWALVCLDPLARFADAPVESDNSLATAFIQSVEIFAAALPGHPATEVACHSSKVAKRAGQVDARGVTGLHDGVRAVLTLRCIQAEGGLSGVLLEHTKSNCARQVEPIWLIRLDNEQTADGRFIETGGAFRLATKVEAEILDQAAGVKSGDLEAKTAQREERKRNEVADKNERRSNVILDTLAKGPMSSSGVVLALEAAGLSLTNGKTAAFLREMVTRGLVRNSGTLSRPQWTLASGVS